MRISYDYGKKEKIKEHKLEKTTYYYIEYDKCEKITKKIYARGELALSAWRRGKTF